MNKEITIVEPTLDDARRALKAHLTPGTFLLWTVEQEELPGVEEAYANTTEKAFAFAAKKLPEQSTLDRKEILRDPSISHHEIAAFDEKEAVKLISEQYNRKHIKIQAVKRVKKGNKGFLGIGKTKPRYAVEVFHRAKVAVFYNLLPKIEACITNDRMVAEFSFLAKAKDGDLDGVRHLVEQGIDINFCEDDGATALIISIWNGHPDISRFLIEHGIDLHKKDHGGFDALMVACESHDVGIGLIEKLIAAGADVTAASGRGSTALMAAAKSGDLDAVKLLVAAGADINATNMDHNITPLIWAASEGHLAVVQFLLEKGADPDVLTDNNHTAASIAAENGHHAIVEALGQRHETKPARQYWAYRHKHGDIEVKEWYPGNAYVSEAAASTHVARFLDEPFAAGSIEEAQDIAAELLKQTE